MITTIGRRPIATGKGLMLLVHHTDADREWAYDRESSIGTTKWGRLIRLDFSVFRTQKQVISWLSCFSEL